MPAPGFPRPPWPTCTTDLTPLALRRAHQAFDRAVDRRYRGRGFASERERAEHLFMLYEKMRAPLGVGVKKLKRRRR